MSTPHADQPAFDLLEIAVFLRQCHAAMKRLYGSEEFARRVEELTPLLTKMADKHDGNVQAAAIRWCNDTDMPENMRPLVLAIATELKLRENAAVCAEGRS